MTTIKICPRPETCKAETDYGTGVTECPCGAIGYLSKDGNLYNDPGVAKRASEKVK